MEFRRVLFRIFKVSLEFSLLIVEAIQCPSSDCGLIHLRAAAHYGEDHLTLISIDLNKEEAVALQKAENDATKISEFLQERADRITVTEDKQDSEILKMLTMKYAAKNIEENEKRRKKENSKTLFQKGEDAINSITDFLKKK